MHPADGETRRCQGRNPKHIRSHTRRRSFATDIHRDTSSIRLTQKASGHANLATTQIYAHIVDEELDQAMKSFRKAKVAAKARWIDTLHAITADSSSEDHPSKAVS